VTKTGYSHLLYSCFLEDKLHVFMQAGKYFPVSAVVVVCPVKHCMWENSWSYSWKFSHCQEKSNIFCHIQNEKL